jgi:hypothetical protein
VLSFIQKFQQNSLLNNVNLSFGQVQKHILQPVLSRLLPLFNGIVSVEVANSAQLADIYNAGNSKDFSGLTMNMMENARFLAVR